MFVRPFREPVAIVCIGLASFMPTATLAGQHHAEAVGASHGPSFTFSIGRRSLPISTSIHLRDFSHMHETMKPLELATPAPTPEPTFPSFANPLHRHRMAMIVF
jgi:hypothetical protein